MNYADSIEKSLTPDLWRLIALLGEVGASQDQRLYLVGGRVRDLLLGIEGGDLDLVVEGDAMALARSLAKDHGGEVVSHPRFGTAKYRSGDLTIDLATARSEVYSRPGALPQVRPGSIDRDLSRRDFTINSMAVCLSPPDMGSLLDPFDGRADLEARLIRVLHPKSFIDDATRIMRAIRYEQRLSFKIEDATRGYLLRDLSYLDTVGVDRLRHELQLFLEEGRPEEALHRADELGVLKAMHPSLKADGWTGEMFRKARSTAQAATPEVYLALLLYRMSPEDALDLVKGYRFARDQVRIVSDLIKLKTLEKGLGAPGLKPRELYAMLHNLAPEALTAFSLACEGQRTRDIIVHYLDELRHVKTSLDGHELKLLGVPQGPGMGRMLKALLDARLDGEVANRETEVALVKRWLAEGGPE
ncbi:MAG: CCA tRNA nucleotidyltransferase [Chloroflexi bacterium]|nr:CCA tRNA nucleotidyltransferase [Chloroflexota bacterium]